MDMENYLPIIIAAAALAAVYIGMSLKNAKAQKRQQEMKDVAQSLGYLDSAFSSSKDVLLRFKLPAQGFEPQIKNVLHCRKDGLNTVIFDFHYFTGMGRERMEHDLTAVFISSEKLEAVPDFSLEPENFWSRVQDKFASAQDIDFKERPSFSKKFKLQAADENAARAFFDDELFDYFETRPKLDLEVLGGMMLYASETEKLTPTEGIPKLLEQAQEVYGLLAKKLGVGLV